MYRHTNCHKTLQLDALMNETNEQRQGRTCMVVLAGDIGEVLQGIGEAGRLGEAIEGEGAVKAREAEREGELPLGTDSLF